MKKIGIIGYGSRMSSLVHHLLKYNDCCKIVAVADPNPDFAKNHLIEYKQNMVKRLSTQVCTAEGSIIYSNILINFERVGDHLLNIAQNSALIK